MIGAVFKTEAVSVKSFRRCEVNTCFPERLNRLIRDRRRSFLTIFAPFHKNFFYKLILNLLTSQSYAVKLRLLVNLMRTNSSWYGVRTRTNHSVRFNLWVIRESTGSRTEIVMFLSAAFDYNFVEVTKFGQGVC